MQYDRVWGYIESGKREGARVLIGGEKRKTPGYYVDATSAVNPFRRIILYLTCFSASVFADIRPDMKIVRRIDLVTLSN